MLKGTKKYKKNGRELICCCPLHIDSNPSFSINLDNGRWICFAGCGQGGIKKLYKLLNLDYAANKVENKEDELDTMMRGLQDKETVVEVNEEATVLDDKILDHYKTKDYEYMLSRGFTEKTLKKFEIGRYRNFVTIPVRDEKGRLLAVLGRALDKSEAKYKPIIPSKGYPKSKVLFGLDKIGKNINTVLIVEGPLDAMKAQQFSVPSVAIQGSSISKGQINLIMRHFGSVCVATDNDDAGKEAKKKIVKALRGKCIISVLVFPENVKDVGEMDRHQLLEAIKNRKVVL